MSKKATGLALIAAALLIAAVGSVVSARVLRVGMMDYEVYPCTYNANAGYYVPWDGNAAGQFWISAPVWEWGGDGGALCADSDGDWRDNGVLEGAPNPEFGEEYRRTQYAFNARQAAFSASVVSLAAQIAEREERARREAERLALEGEEEGEPARPGSPPDPLTLYQGALVDCYSAYSAARGAATSEDEREAADTAYSGCLRSSIRTYSAPARQDYNERLTALQTSCRASNPTDDDAYNTCVSAGRVGSSSSEECTYAVARRAPSASEPNTYTLRERDRNNNVVVVYVDGTEDEQTSYCTQYDTPLIDPDPVLNPTPTASATPTPDPAYTAEYNTVTARIVGAADPCAEAQAVIEDLDNGDGPDEDSDPLRYMAWQDAADDYEYGGNGC